MSDVLKLFVMQQAGDLVLLSKALNFAALVLHNSAEEIVGYARVDAARLAGEYVNGIAVFAAHSP
jgi:hypothetical protein